VRALAEAPLPRGGAWGKGVILYQPLSLGPLWSVPDAGGTPTVATMVDSAHGHQGHRFPQFLPDGRHFIMAIVASGPNRVAVGAIGERRVHPLFETTGSSGATFAAGEWLVAAREGTIKAQHFDTRTLKTVGPALEVPGLRALAPNANGSQVVSASSNGVLLQRGATELPQRLSLVDRQGRVLADFATPIGTYTRGSLSPDGRKAVFEFVAHSGDDSQVWTADLVRGDVQPLSVKDQNVTPAFSPDGRMIAMSRESDVSNQDLWVMAADAPASLRLARRMPGRFQSVLGWSPDGLGVVLRTQGTSTRQDLIYAPIDSTAPIRALRATSANEPMGAISPDGHWLAYVSNESGRMEVRVTSFANPDGPATVVSRGCFAEPTANSRVGLPAWRRDGRELLYVAPDSRTFMVVPVTPGATPAFGEPRPLFRMGSAVADVAVGPDLDRFLLSITRDEEGRSSATVLLHWPRLLETEK
jgi:hypothetical protein